MTPQDIKTIRDYYGDTQTKFGKRLGVSLATVSRWELGNTTPQTMYHKKKLEKMKKAIDSQLIT